MYFIIGEPYGYTEENNGNKCLVFATTDKNQEILTKYSELWHKIKNLIENINNKAGEYRNNFMKSKLDSDNNLPLNKILKLHNLTKVVRSAFQEGNKYYPQLF